MKGSNSASCHSARGAEVVMLSGFAVPLYPSPGLTSARVGGILNSRMHKPSTTLIIID